MELHPGELEAGSCGSRETSGSSGGRVPGAPRRRYEYTPGAVDILQHTDGSGALLESRIGDIVTLISECQHEVRAA